METRQEGSQVRIWYSWSVSVFPVMCVHEVMFTCASEGGLETFLLQNLSYLREEHIYYGEQLKTYFDT